VHRQLAAPLRSSRAQKTIGSRLLRENYFGNTVSSNLDAVETVLVEGLRSMESNLPRTQKLTGFDWIASISMKAN
jgi:hypothetical protein